jgi:hypothetical protein
VTYTIDVAGLPLGDYALDPSYSYMSPAGSGGTSAFVLEGQVTMPVHLTFDPGVLSIAVPEPSSVVLAALAAFVGIVPLSRRRSGYRVRFPKTVSRPDDH